MGETSGSSIRALSLGKPLVVCDVGWFAELPDEVALKVPAGRARGRGASPARSSGSPPIRRRASEGPRPARYAAREHALPRVADAYAAALEQAAGGDAVSDASCARSPRPPPTSASAPTTRRGELATRLARSAWRLRRRAARAATARPRSRAFPSGRGSPASSPSRPASATRSRAGWSRRGSWSTSSSTRSSRRASPRPGTS